MRIWAANKSGRARLARCAHLVPDCPTSLPKESSSTGWSQNHAVRLHPRGRSSRSRMNIVVFPSPYKHKMPGTGPVAVFFFHRSPIYYFLQETKREVPNYFASSANEMSSEITISTEANH